MAIFWTNCVDSTPSFPPSPHKAKISGKQTNKQTHLGEFINWKFVIWLHAPQSVFASNEPDVRRVPCWPKKWSRVVRRNKMDLHQLPGSLYSFPQLYSVIARELGQDTSSCSADDKMIEKLIVYFTGSGENTTLYLYPQHGPSLRIFAKGILLLVHVISFFFIYIYNAAI